jgi:hypothetical protein
MSSKQRESHPVDLAAVVVLFWCTVVFEWALQGGRELVGF